MTLHVITQVIARLPSNLIYKITRSYEFIWLLFWGASHDANGFLDFPWTFLVSTVIPSDCLSVKQMEIIDKKSLKISKRP